MRNEIISGQKQLWDDQHFQRGVTGEEGNGLRDTPNQAAIHLDSRLVRGSVIFEVGSANGRDARFWAKKGHSVIATDFSKVALTQLDAIAQEQGIGMSIKTVEWDLNSGKIPIKSLDFIDAFYARSALHISDDAMHFLGKEITRVSKRGALIVVEGKTETDPKIKRSKDLGNGLRLDFDGHLRRSFTEDFMEEWADKAGWSVEDLRTYEETTAGKGAEFMRLTARKWR